MKLIVEQRSPLAATEVVACEIAGGADFGCVWHDHPEVEITRVKRGGTERYGRPVVPSARFWQSTDQPDRVSDRFTSCAFST